jgi:hypothetical protein
MSRNFFRDHIENLPKTTLFISCQQRKKEGKKKGVYSHPREENVKKMVFVFFHRNCLKKKV